MLRDALLQAGHEVATPAVRRAALDAVPGSTPSLIISDWEMPG